MSSSNQKSDSSAAKKPKSFEPASTQDTSAKVKKTPAIATPKSSPAVPASASAIPEAVSRRMIKRMAWLSGVPTGMAMVTFVVSYFLITKDIVDLPNYIVLVLSLGFFGLGIVGLSYGVLSASWDESQPGSWIGLDEFKLNWERMTTAKSEAKSEAKARAKAELKRSQKKS
jgi:Photosynthesis affected mutant 68